MKRLLVGLVVLTLLFFAGAIRAADQDADEKRKLLEEAKAKINNVEWKIKLTPIGETPARAYEDTLSFINTKVSSKKLESEGFATSNYTVSLKGEDVIVWETMQTSEEAGLAFWHGEWEDNVMRGVLSKHPDDKTHLDFSFFSTEKKELTPPPMEVKEEKKKPAPVVPKPKVTKQEEPEEEVTPQKVEKAKEQEEVKEGPTP